MIMLGSSFQNLSAIAAEQLLPILGFIVDTVRNFLHGWENLLQIPVIGWIAPIAAGLVGLVGILLIAAAGSGRMAASGYAATTALTAMAESGQLANNSFTRLLGSIFGVNVASLANAAASDRAAAAQAAHAAAAFELNLQLLRGEITLAEYNVALDALSAAESRAAFGAKALKFALVTSGIGIAVLAIGSLVGSMMQLGDASKQAAGGTDELVNAQGMNQAQVDAANKAIDEQNASLTDLGSSGGSASQAAAKIRTLADYSRDLSTIWNRAFEFRFSGQKTLDNINKSWHDIAKGAMDARKEIDSLNTDISGLTADKALQEYYLTIASAYGDTIAAAKAQANLAKINNDLKNKNTALADAQDSANKSLVGNSDAAIQNRSDIMGLVQAYQEHVKALADSGMSQEDLLAQSAILRQDFINQATQLGYNVNELGTYIQAIDDTTFAINNIPRDITVDANIDPAKASLAEFVAIATQSGMDAGSGAADALNKAFQEHYEDPNIKYSIGPSEESVNYWDNLWYDLQLIGENMNLHNNKNIWDSLKPISPWFADGGYTGPGGKYDVAGIVHKGEYVVPKSQVNQSTGLPYYMQQTPKFFSGGSSVGGSSNSSNVVALSAGSIQAIAQAVQPMLYLDGQKISDASSTAYSNNTKVGAF